MSWQPAAVLVVLSAMLLPACGVPAAPAPSESPPGPVRATTSPGDPESLDRAYAAAVRRARSDELPPARRLVSLRPGTPGLSLNRNGTEVLTVTITSPTEFGSSVGRRVRVPTPVWVTAVPQLQRFCRGYVRAGGGETGLRIRQYVGLPADRSPDVVVTLRVPIRRLFRPTPDPRVTTRRVDLDPQARPERAFPGFRRWYRRQLATAYNPAQPYPWTGRGYTYDWGDPGDPVGASEFVVRRGTRVTVVAQDSPARYCAD